MNRAVLAAALLVCSWQASAAAPTPLRSAVAAALGQRADFVHASVELNQDSRADAIVLVRGAEWCGTGGCVMLVFRGIPGGFALVSRSTITSAPVRVLPTSRLGWRDLIVHSNGIGDVVLHFNGTRYPSNPSLQSAPTPQQLRSAVVVLGQASDSSLKLTPDGAPQFNP
jgi:hypothetical protein